MTAISEQEQAILARREERFFRRSSHTAARYLRDMEALPGLPNAMEPFLTTLRHIYVDHKGIATSRPCIGTYCAMVPQELIYAAGGMPIKLCSGHYTAFQIGDDSTPRDACPLVKAVAGFHEMKTMPIYENCKLMVVPTTCDCKKKWQICSAREPTFM